MEFNFVEGEPLDKIEPRVNELEYQDVFYLHVDPNRTPHMVIKYVDNGNPRYLNLITGVYYPADDFYVAELPGRVGNAIVVRIKAEMTFHLPTA